MHKEDWKRRRSGKQSSNNSDCKIPVGKDSTLLNLTICLKFFVTVRSQMKIQTLTKRRERERAFEMPRGFSFRHLDNEEILFEMEYNRFTTALDDRSKKNKFKKKCYTSATVKFHNLQSTTKQYIQSKSWRRMIIRTRTQGQRVNCTTMIRAFDWNRIGLA